MIVADRSEAKVEVVFEVSRAAGIDGAVVAADVCRVGDDEFEELREEVDEPLRCSVGHLGEAQEGAFDG